MPINAVIDVSAEPYTGDEPLTLAAAKNYMKIDFADDDDLISAMIIAARERLEKYLGLSLVQKTLTVQLNNGCGKIELPYGPVTDDVDLATITDIQGTVINSSLILITGNQFKTLHRPCYPFIQVVYDAGYEQLPKPILEALKAEVFFRYDNRGEARGADYVCDAAKQLCKQYRRVFDMIF